MVRGPAVKFVYNVDKWENRLAFSIRFAYNSEGYLSKKRRLFP